MRLNKTYVIVLGTTKEKLNEVEPSETTIWTREMYLQALQKLYSQPSLCTAAFNRRDYYIRRVHSSEN